MKSDFFLEQLTQLLISQAKADINASVSQSNDDTETNNKTLNQNIAFVKLGKQ